MKSWYEQVKYYSDAWCKLWIPLNTKTNSWICLCWAVKEPKEPSYYTSPLVYVDSTCVSLTHRTELEFGKTGSEPLRFTPFKADLTTVIRFIQAEIYKVVADSILAEPTKLQITVAFGAKDDWKALSSQWTPELLSKVDRFILEVGAGRSSEDVRELLEVVKNSTVEDIKLFDFDDSMAMEEGISALKGSKNIKFLEYSNDEGEPNNIVVDSLIDLTTNLPSLEILTLSLVDKMWNSKFVGPLLDSTFKLKIKTLVLKDVSPTTEIDFVGLLKNVVVEKLVVNFKKNYTSEVKTISVLIEGLKGSNLAKLEILNIELKEEISKKLAESLLEMPQIQYLGLEAGEIIPKHLVDLINKSKTLNTLVIDGGCNAKSFVPDVLLKAVTINETLETLDISSCNFSYINLLVELLKNNRTLKMMSFGSTYHSKTYLSSGLEEAIKANKTLKYLQLNTFDYTSFSKAEDIKNELSSRDVKFSYI